MASEIIASVDGPRDGDRDAAWLAELDRRADSAKAPGRIQAPRARRGVDRVGRNVQTECRLRRARRPASNEQIHAAVGVTPAAITLTYADSGVGQGDGGLGHGNNSVVLPSGSLSEAARGLPRRRRVGRSLNHAPFSVNQAADGVNLGDAGVIRPTHVFRRAARPPPPCSRDPGHEKQIALPTVNPAPSSASLSDGPTTPSPSCSNASPPHGTHAARGRPGGDDAVDWVLPVVVAGLSQLRRADSREATPSRRIARPSHRGRLADCAP